MDEQTADSAAWERVGAQLRAARERQGLTLHDLATRTKIKDALLEAIERGEIEKVPRGPFRRGFARAYALEVGLDPEALLARFRPEPIVVPQATVAPAVEPRLTSAAFAGRLFVSVIVMAAAIMVPRWTMTSEEASEPEGGPEIVQAVATAGVQPADEIPADATAPQTQPQAPPIAFALRATEEVWLDATADGERVAYDLLPAGAERTLVAQKSLAVRIGSAGAIEYSINGTPGAPLGTRGQVRDLHLTPDTLSTLR